MGLISDLLSRKAIALHGAELARQFGKRLTKERVGDEKRVNAEVDILAASALGFHRKSHLGVFGKSHLVNSIQWTLIDQGYPDDFAREIGNQLAMRLASGD